jgi:CMP-N-acetylneuraminic acid synthetase
MDGFFKKAKKKITKDLLGDNFTSNIKTYVEIFPNRKLSSGKYARVNPKNLENSFRWFFENYEYDWDMIFKATKKYIYDYSLKNYEYMRTSQYFIRKQNIDKTYDSELADYCNMIDNVLDDEVVFIKERRL